MTELSQNLYAVQAQIAQAAAQAGRVPDSVRLIAVTKTHPEEAVLDAIAAGQRLFGENRVQEAITKYMPLRETCPDLELHLIGPLQTNKAGEAVALFDVIQTLDRPKLAEALAREMKKQNRTPRLYIEVNTGNEPQKAGVAPYEVEDFLLECEGKYGLKITGLMCVPPFNEDPAPHFKLMSGLAHKLHLPHLSMGMSSDYETAIACGATEVRVGTAIFGSREIQPR